MENNMEEYNETQLELVIVKTNKEKLNERINELFEGLQKLERYVDKKNSKRNAHSGAKIK
jgi:hypothetical protein